MALLASGQTFSGYRLVALISRGGMGEVWRATKEGEGGWKKEVALKVILPTFSGEGRFVEMFLAEARIAALLDHPNIVAVFATGRDGDLCWFEQELVHGEDLGRLLRRTPRGFPLPLALLVAADMLKALAYAHERRGGDGRPLGIIHRDVKPHNLLLAREGHAKLGDFGIAKVTAQGSVSASELKGTAGYIAPELLDGAPATVRSDLFGAGLVLWELLCGRKLFDAEQDVARLKKTFECVVPTLAAVGADVPAEVEKVLLGLLARDPAGRYASAAEALHAVLAAPHGREASTVELKRFLMEVSPAQSGPALAPTVPSDRDAVPEYIHEPPAGPRPSEVPTRTRQAVTVTLAGQAKTKPASARALRRTGRGARAVIAALMAAGAIGGGVRWLGAWGRRSAPRPMAIAQSRPDAMARKVEVMDAQAVMVSVDAGVVDARAIEKRRGRHGEDAQPAAEQPVVPVPNERDSVILPP